MTKKAKAPNAKAKAAAKQLEDMAAAKLDQLPDAIVDKPRVVVRTSDVIKQLEVWLADARGTTPRKRNSDTVADLIYDIHQTCEGWIQDLEDEDL